MPSRPAWWSRSSFAQCGLHADLHKAAWSGPWRMQEWANPTDEIDSTRQAGRDVLSSGSLSCSLWHQAGVPHLAWYLFTTTYSGQECWLGVHGLCPELLHTAMAALHTPLA